jgi:hypothetical protein
MTIAWRVTLTQNETENNSDKTFTVPASIEWEILWIRVGYTTSAVAGARQLEIQMQDTDSSVIAQWQTGITQGESSNYNYLFGVGVPDLLIIRDDNYLMTPMMGATFLTEGQKIRVWDNNAIDPTGDDMMVQIEHGYHDI